MTTGHGLIVSAALALALTACTDDDPKADPSPSATASAEPTATESTATESTATESVDPSNVSPDGLPTIPQVKGAKGDIGALTLGECHTEAGRQTVTGEVTSSAAKSTDYLVTLSWTTGDSDVMGRGFAVVRDLEPGATEGFTIKAAVAKGAAQCVPGVVYGNVAGT